MSSEHVPRKLAREVAQRAQWRCEYCLSPAAYSTQPFEVDHVIPRSKGGRTISDNLAFSCGCNSYKAHRTQARDPQTGRSIAFFHPRRQVWSRHFLWSEDRLHVLGRTATGRVTVAALHLNRLELVNLRRALLAIGEHCGQRAGEL